MIEKMSSVSPKMHGCICITLFLFFFFNFTFKKIPLLTGIRWVARKYVSKCWVAGKKKIGGNCNEANLEHCNYAGVCVWFCYFVAAKVTKIITLPGCGKIL